MVFEIEKKNAVVIGGAGGIGFEVCKHLLQHKVAKLALIDIHESREEILKELRSDFPLREEFIIYEKCDITIKSELKNVLEVKLKAKFGYIDILVNAAGVADEHDIEKLIQVNMTGVINSTLIATDLMSKSKGGTGGVVVNIASIAGFEPVMFMPIYSATKFAVCGLTRSLGSPSIYEKTGVKYLTVCPGATETNLYHNCQNKLLFSELEDEFQQLIAKLPLQSPSVVGDCVARAVATGKNGSLWICESGNIEEKTFSSKYF